jgi:uncharacterized membrane protein YGL010W
MTSKLTVVSSSLDHKISPGLVLAHFFSGAALFIIVSAAFDFADITDLLAFYGVYHRNPTNQLIHFFGVPGILWTIIIFLVHLKVPMVAGTTPSVVVKKILPVGHQITYGLLLTLFYLFFYLTIDPFGGILYAPVLYAMYMSAVYLTDQDQQKVDGKKWSGTGKLLLFTLVLHLFSWWIQIAVGHVIEGAQPASLQSLGGAVTVAPLFAFYEGLWYLGINKKLQTQTLKLVEQYTYDICTSGKVQMTACEGLRKESSNNKNVEEVPEQTNMDEVREENLSKDVREGVNEHVREHMNEELN